MNACADGAGKVRLILPSSVCHLPLVNAVAEEFAREMDFDQDSVEAVAVSVVEISTNAIQHGHGYDPEKEVEISFEREGKDLVVTVCDSGPGFDVASLPDPLSPQNLMRDSGRGIFICRSFMDEVDFDTGPERGTKVRLVKRKTPREGGEEDI